MGALDTHCWRHREAHRNMHRVYKDVEDALKIANDRVRQSPEFGLASLADYFETIRLARLVALLREEHSLAFHVALDEGHRTRIRRAIETLKGMMAEDPVYVICCPHSPRPKGQCPPKFRIVQAGDALPEGGRPVVVHHCLATDKAVGDACRQGSKRALWPKPAMSPTAENDDWDDEPSSSVSREQSADSWQVSNISWDEPDEWPVSDKPRAPPPSDHEALAALAAMEACRQVAYFSADARDWQRIAEQTQADAGGEATSEAASVSDTTTVSEAPGPRPAKRARTWN